MCVVNETFLLDDKKCGLPCRGGVGSGVGNDVDCKCRAGGVGSVWGNECDCKWSRVVLEVVWVLECGIECRGWCWNVVGLIVDGMSRVVLEVVWVMSVDVMARWCWKGVGHECDCGL
ncbi:hypothetical protein HNY73_013877 [Argiope bruennichi]|uniref:Uncharacterized protein n=1 Tax=Argiope bruennichi TaxID=94029 RepID=A0A8T0EM13_ARGBR|nr:hypothetical protein HNY73_013877 [Argiope bruennichi]